jgi:threonine/homoserine/homoserine lactone efflux protein
VTTRSVLTFLGVAVLLFATPGQDTALTVRNTLIGGRRAGFSTVLGICAGQSIWVVSTGLGVGAIIVASEPAIDTLRVLGIGWLLLLGVRAILGAMRSRPGEDVALDDGTDREIRASAAFRQGLLSNLLNPKMVVFFTSLLPQFARSFTMLLGLGFVFNLMTLTWPGGYTFVVSRATRMLRRPPVRQAIEAATGIAQVALGARLAMGGGWR